MTIISNNNERAQSLYTSLLDELIVDQDQYAVLIIQHLVPNTVPFFKALRSKFEVIGIIPKRRSIDPATLSMLEGSDPPFTILNGTRSHLNDREYLNSHIGSKLGEKKLIILDIGGYFSESIEVLNEEFGEKIAGIVEDTENGHQKYEKFLDAESQNGRNFPFPVYSVARSPLKEPEDHLVGQAVTYSTESILRRHNTLLTNQVVLVIGYGKIGKSVAHSLAVRNITVWVHDNDPIRSAQALAHGFYAPEREFGITNADLIFGASGNQSLREEDFYKLKDCAFVSSVTSADDEFDFGSIREDLSFRDTGADAEIFYLSDGRIFHLLNEGNAVNFLHGAVLGTYIYLVACELIGCVARIIQDKGSFQGNAVSVLSKEERKNIANAWVGEFNKNATA